MSIDWTKPVYDAATGDECFALCGRDGKPFMNRGGRVNVIRGGYDHGWWPADSKLFTNTPPKPEWSMTKELAYGSDRVLILYGRRDGKLFVEILK